MLTSSSHRRHPFFFTLLDNSSPFVPFDNNISLVEDRSKVTAIITTKAIARRLAVYRVSWQKLLNHKLNNNPFIGDVEELETNERMNLQNRPRSQ